MEKSSGKNAENDDYRTRNTLYGGWECKMIPPEVEVHLWLNQRCMSTPPTASLETNMAKYFSLLRKTRQLHVSGGGAWAGGQAIAPKQKQLIFEMLLSPHCSLEGITPDRSPQDPC